MGWKESKQTSATGDDVVSETSSEHNKDLTGKKASVEGVQVATAIREVQ
jgi:hypothetical protein